MDEKGISLLELLTVVVMVGMIITLLANIPNALSLMSKSSHLSIVREIITKQIEDKRAIGFANLVNGSQNITDTQISKLPSGIGTIDVQDCPLSICTNGEHLKAIIVTVNWTDNSKTQSTKLNTFIGEAGIK